MPFGQPRGERGQLLVQPGVLLAVVVEAKCSPAALASGMPQTAPHFLAPGRLGFGMLVRLEHLMLERPRRAMEMKKYWTES